MTNSISNQAVFECFSIWIYHSIAKMKKHIFHSLIKHNFLDLLQSFEDYLGILKNSKVSWQCRIFRTSIGNCDFLFYSTWEFFIFQLIQKKWSEFVKFQNGRRLSKILKSRFSQKLDLKKIIFLEIGVFEKNYFQEY